MSWGGTAFVFGRYSGRTFADVAEKERGYCVWVMREYLKFGSKSYRPCSPQLIEFAEWLLYYRFEILPENERPTDGRARGRRNKVKKSLFQITLDDGFCPARASFTRSVSRSRTRK